MMGGSAALVVMMLVMGRGMLAGGCGVSGG
jgi:hypothetical protein